MQHQGRRVGKSSAAWRRKTVNAVQQAADEASCEQEPARAGLMLSMTSLLQSDSCAEYCRATVPFMRQSPEYHAGAEYAKAMQHAVDRLTRLGGQQVPVDFGPFLKVASLLYESGLIAERYHGILDFLTAGKVRLPCICHACDISSWQARFVFFAFVTRVTVPVPPSSTRSVIQVVQGCLRI